ncbi:MAG: DUF3131 domain-containing protein [Hyphomicrobiaceae bacterium]|nr:DUF3131 domain-containing protein [Hyphomicrobiaceae bacterium]
MPLTRRALLKMGVGLPPFAFMLGHNSAFAAPEEREMLTAGQRAELIEDARAAWQYFEQPGPHLTGLVPANVWREGDGFGSYRIVTMWDVGSILLATLSAHALGIIDDASYSKRLDGLNGFLRKATYRFRRASLPNFRSSVDSAKSIEAGYDATDTARLFVALHILDRLEAPALNGGDLIRSWNLDRTIQDGQICSIKGGRLEAAEFYVYRYYVSRAYALWSVAHKPVTSGELPSAGETARQAFLEELKRIGPISSEPSLSEEVELGGSAHSREIVSVLNAAQNRRYQETSRLTCVSESPVDQEPWFTYQGYDLARESDGEAAWTVYPWKTEAKWDTPEFAAKFRMVSSKAAFLWFATHPSAYTEKLWRHVREHARAPKYGFHPGVYDATGKPSRNIDVNTNATILEAIAYALRQRKPLIA